MPVLPMKEFFDVLRDIFYKDLGIPRSVVKYDWQLRFICGYTHDGKHAEIRRNVTISIGGEYRKLCEDSAWNGLRGVNATAVWKQGATFCRGNRPSQVILKRSLCDDTYDCMDRSDEAGCFK